jgi:hypothetical protein
MDHLSILASWGAKAAEEAQGMINGTVACVLKKLGETSITISPADLEAMPQFEAKHTEDGLVIRIRASEDPGQAGLFEEHTGDEVASRAGRILGDPDSSADAKSVAASALTQHRRDA